MGEMRYLGKSKMLFNNHVLKNPKHFKLLVEEKNTPELTKVFKRHKRKHRTHQILAVSRTLSDPQRHSVNLTERNKQ